MKLIKKSSELTPELIVAQLFHYHNVAHWYHLNTGAIGRHLLLDDLYKRLVKDKDKIGEYLLGLQAPKRFTSLKLEEVPQYTPEALWQFLNEGFDFTVRVVDYADEHKLEQLSNLISATQGAFSKAKLFFTYKGDEK